MKYKPDQTILKVVALRKESVDRNDVLATSAVLELVALRKESVDRNVFLTLTVRNVPIVALRKESVDRNYKERPGQKARPKSLSARRAWIEIVDPDADSLTDDGRSPQGERG